MTLTLEKEYVTACFVGLYDPDRMCLVISDWAVVGLVSGRIDLSSGR